MSGRLLTDVLAGLQPTTPERRAELQRQLARWQAWACPARPSSMLDEPVLAMLRERGPDIPEHLAALDRECASARGCRVDELPWNLGAEGEL